MKKLLLSAFVAFSMLATTKTFAQQGFGTNTPDKSAAVDIVSSQRGLLIPRLNLSATNVASPVTAPAQSLFVYNQATSNASVAPANRVTPGFYYWDTNRWVRFRSEGSEKTTVVTAGNNVEVDATTSPDGLTTTYKVGVAAGTQGQVLVTVNDGGTLKSEWVNPEDFITGVNGITVTPVTDPATGITTNEVALGGPLTKDTEIDLAGNDLAIKGLPTVPNVTNETVMVMDPTTGLLKQVTVANLVNAQDLSTDGIIGVGADATSATANTLADAVLTPTYLKIKDNAITAQQIATGAVGTNELATGAVTADKLSTKDSETGTIAPPNTVPVANADGTVTYKTIAQAAGEDLTTDGKIVIGATNATTLADAVLVATSLKIAPESITSADILNGTIESSDIKDGTITTTDIQAPGSTTNTGGTANQVMVTDAAGNVSWVAQSALPSNTVIQNGVNTTVNGDGSTTNPYKIDVNTANATTTGAVKQAAAGTEEVTIAADGTLSVNEANVVVRGDVTGNLGATTVSGIQGVGVSDADPTATNNMLVFNPTSGQWEPSTVAAAAGKTLTTDDVIQITGTGTTTNSAAQTVLKDINLAIGADKITATHIAADAVGASELANDAVASENIINGTIKTEDIQAPGSSTNTGGTANQVMVTDAAGNVSWVAQSALPSNTQMANGLNTTVEGNGSAATPFKVNVATASGTTLGVVKQADTNAEVLIDATGALSIDESKVVLSGDVTGPLNDTNVAAIQGTAVSATAPLNNQILAYNGTAWTPTAPTTLVAVDNGISKSATDGDIILGGTLNEAATDIKTGGASNTLAISGLIAPTTASEIVYAQTADGVLRKAARSISQAITSSQTVNTITGYSDFVQEIIITAEIGTADINVTLPAATATNKGQVVNVKITNTTEPANYVNILTPAGTLTYGALPYQGWIVKSNGTAWEIVARN